MSKKDCHFKNISEYDKNILHMFNNMAFRKHNEKCF